MRIDKVYTRGGDTGETSLGSGKRVSKRAPRIEAYGTVDELNAVLGLVLASEPAEGLCDPLEEIQQQLFDLGADLCVEEAAKKPDSLRIEAHQVTRLEQWIDELNAPLDPLESFILPGGTRAAAALHLGRTLCRRAERRVVALAEVETVSAAVIGYLNRLSDLLFVMARVENARHRQPDRLWNPKR